MNILITCKPHWNTNCTEEFHTGEIITWSASCFSFFLSVFSCLLSFEPSLTLGCTYNIKLNIEFNSFLQFLHGALVWISWSLLTPCEMFSLSYPSDFFFLSCISWPALYQYLHIICHIIYVQLHTYTDNATNYVSSPVPFHVVALFAFLMLHFWVYQLLTLCYSTCSLLPM